MASVTACSRLLVLTCGERVALLDFSQPDEFVTLSLPQTPNAAPQSEPHSGKLDGNNISLGKDKKNAKPPSKGPESNRILASSVSADGQYLALCDDHKYLHVYQRRSADDGGTSGWPLVSSRCVSRRCTAVRFDDAPSTVIVADKSGDVFAFPVQRPAAAAAAAVVTSKEGPEVSQGHAEKEEEGQAVALQTSAGGDKNDDDDNDGDAVAAAEEATSGDADDASCGQPLLGHLSMLLDMVLIQQDGLIVTSDRDEKIRVSRYPDAYNIHTYCLGHAAFVISLACDLEKHLLFSGSGDCTVRVWDYRQGKQLALRHCLEDLTSEFESDGGDTNMEQNSDQTGESKDEVSPVDTTDTDTDADAKGDVSHQPAVLQIAYCQQCCLLFVAMDRSPDVLVYQLTSSSSSADELKGQVSLKSLAPINGQGHVLSLCVQGCVIWCVREEEDSQSPPELKLTAHKVEGCDRDGFKITALSAEGDSSGSRILNTVSKNTDFFKDAPARQDLSILWKSHIDGYVGQYLERKRQRLEGKDMGNNSDAKHKRS